MADNQVVLNTVKRMIATGVDDDTIAMTLKGIGMSDAEIQGYLAKAKGEEQGNEEEQDDSENEEQGEDADEDSEDDGSEDDDYEGIDDSDVEAPASASKPSMREDAQNAQHAATHGMLEQHSGRLDDIKEDVSGIHQKLDSAPKLSPGTISKIENLDKRISGLEKEISETKANTLALQGLLEKILETNRKTLLSLEKKK